MVSGGVSSIKKVVLKNFAKFTGKHLWLCPAEPLFFWFVICTCFVLLFLDILLFFSIWLGFLWQPFMNHRTAGEEGRRTFHSSLPLPSAHRHLDISQVFTAESSPLIIGTSRTRTGNLWFLSNIHALFFNEEISKWLNVGSYINWFCI